MPPPPLPVMKMRRVAGDDADFLFHALEEFEDLFGLLGVVALVVAARGSCRRRD